MATVLTDNKQESLNPLEFTRLKPGVYCGDCSYSTQLLIEAFSNSFDELFRLIRNGSRIDGEIKVNIVGSEVTVEDNGNGFNINSKMDNGTTELESAFSRLNTSGKYREDGTYEGVSLGNFGIGAKLPNFLSHSADVISIRNGEFEHIWFEEGVFKKRETGKTKDNNGTKYTWNPSEDYFKDTKVEIERVKKYLKTEACLCPGIKIILTIDGKQETYLSKDGLIELVDEELGDTEIINNRLVIGAKEGKNQLDLVMTYTSNYSSTIIPYVNTGETKSGDHITRLKATLTREMNKFFKLKKWLKESDSNLTGDDIAEGLYVIFNYIVPNVKYDAQVKSTVTEIDTKFLTSTFSEELNDWMETNEKELKSIVDKALLARKAREAAKKARDAAREGKKKKKEKLIVRDVKLADCSSNNRKECEVFLVEGDSAAGNLKTIRNRLTQAVMPLRGKVLNVEKATLEKIKGNAEIVNIIDSLGLETDVATLKLTYDKDTLRYDKIILMADADVDGNHICALLLTLFWNFCKELILDGHVYIGVPPLYLVTEGNNKRTFCRDDEDLANYKAKHPGKKMIIKHLKGLGEMSAEESDILTNPETRTICQVTVDNISECERLFGDLMGNNVLPRKLFIENYNKEKV